MDLDESLDRVRALKNSKIQVQQKQATLLAAIEATISPDGAPASPTAYFSALVGLLNQPDAASSVVYLLSLVLPFVSQQILVQKMDVVVSKIAPILTAEDTENSLLRSCIKVIEQLLIAQPYSAWQIPFAEMGPLRTYSGLLALTSDPRPKVRRQAVDSVISVLSSPPPGPKAQHPALFTTADSILDEITTSSDSSDTAALVHALQFAKLVVKLSWPAERYEKLCEILLNIAAKNDQFVVMAAFGIFEVMFNSIAEQNEQEEERGTRLSKKSVLSIISTIRALVPPKTDKQLTPSWFAVLAQASASWAVVDHKSAVEALPDLFATNIEFLSAECPDAVTESSAQCLIAFIVHILAPEVVVQVTTEPILTQLGKQLFSLLHVQYQSAWKEVCQVMVAFLDTVSFKAPLEDAIRVIGVLRSDERLSGTRRYTDEVLSAAIRAYGPEKLLELVPLQLSVSKQGQGVGRAWMLPILRDSIQNANLAHFEEYFIPLAREFDEKAQTMSNQKFAKILSTVRDQIWSLLPRYMDLPRDTKTAFTPEFLQLLLSILYEKIEYRNLICQSLKVIVDSNKVYASGVIENPLMLEAFSVRKARNALDFIKRKYALDILKAMLNVYTTASEQTRPLILETMDSYLGIIDAEEITGLFNQISTVLFESLQGNKMEMCIVMLDVISAIVPYLDQNGYSVFYNIFTALAPRSDNHSLQKKIYGCLTRLAQTEEGQKYIAQQIKPIEDLMIELSSTIEVPARRTRLEALYAIVDLVPSDNLYIIPALLSETMICTKDSNEKTREAAYSLLTLMGQKCKEGGVIDHSELPFLDDDEKVPASLQEYITMLSAGLLGTTPHMVSACILALSYVYHEFYDDIDPDSALEVAETVWSFLTNKNREIVNSTLGFVKVSILALPEDVLAPFLPQLVPQLLEWNKEHSNHFKSKVRHIFERLLRKFGFDQLREVFPEEHIKHLQNIHKSRLRSKRKKADGDDSQKSKGRQFEDELDEALYGSDSDDEGESKPRQSSNKKANGEQYIISGNEPLDLQGQDALSHISSSKPQQNKKRELRHKLSEKDGKIIIRDDDNEDGDDLEPKNAINAYLDAVKSGPVRTESGKLKYKRGKRSQDDMDDDDSGDEKPNHGPKRARKMVPKPKNKSKPHRRGL